MNVQEYLLGSQWLCQIDLDLPRYLESIQKTRSRRKWR
jgi:hypothetical protein